MNITRMVTDFGNSISQIIIDGYYFEMPSSIYEITEKEAKGLFAESVDAENLIQQLVVKIPIDGAERYFKVGEKAKADILGNTHINKLHDKTESLNIPVIFLTSLAFYHAYKVKDLKNNNSNIVIEYFSTMLPTWLVKKANRFSEMLEKMAKRFEGEFEVELLTPNFERSLKIHMKDTTCRVEGETARYALKYDLELNKLESANKFDHAITAINDLGGQTQDLSKLRKGLKKPASADDFASFTDQSYLKMLEKLRTTKLMTHFNDLRSLEAFIYEKVKSKKYNYVDPTTRKETDFTDVIEEHIREFVKVAIQKAITTFTFPSGQTVFFVHFGGVTEVLQDYMKEYLVKELGEEIASEHHIFPPDMRKLNIYGLEIVAKDEMHKRRSNDHEVNVHEEISI